MLRKINLIKRLIMSYNNRILKFQSGGHPAPKAETIGNYIRRSRGILGGFEWYDTSNRGSKLTKEIQVGNWILKPNGTKVHITARQANTQAARNNVAKQAVVNNKQLETPLWDSSTLSWAWQQNPQNSQKEVTQPEVVQDVPQQTQTPKQTTEQTPKQPPKRRVSSRINRPTVKVTPKGQAYWDKQYQDFKSKMTADQKAWLDQKGIDYSSAEQLQGYLSRINKNIDQSFVDNKWGSNSQKAWENFVNTTMKNNPLQTPVEEPILDQPDPFGYSTTNHYGDGMALKELGFNNYSGLKNYVIANQNNQFAKDLKQRFGNDVNAWNQTDVENALGVSGTYRGGYAGDFGDMARSMARWAGQTNAAYDTRKEASAVKPTFNTQEMLNNVKSLKFTTPEWKFSLNQGNIGASTLGDLPSTKPQLINLSQESNKQENLGNLDWIPYAQQTGYIK